MVKNYIFAWLMGFLSLILISGCRHAEDVRSGTMKMIEVAPTEDLMREHGVLARLLLIYEALEAKIAAQVPFEQAILSDALMLTQSFIQEYHEKLEEEYIFPLFEKAGKEVDLIHTLLAQHAAGRTIVADVQKILSRPLLAVSDQEAIRVLLGKLITMYRPHMSREDTVVYPELHTMLSEKAYDELGEKFEDIEHQKFGESGFTGIVTRVAELEKKISIYNLGQFTPHF